MTRKFLTISASILALGIGTASAQESGQTIQDYDTDADSAVNMEEFSQGAGDRLGESYSEFDTDAAGGISQDEFATGTFTRADRSGDQALDEQEFGTTGITSMSFSELDEDGDGMVSQDEWNQAMQTATGPGTFGDYDVDQSGDVTEDEFAGGEFRRFDVNQDETWDEEEFGAWTEEGQNQQSN